MSQDIEKMVLVLALYKKSQDETTTDVLNKLENSGAVANTDKLLSQLSYEKIFMNDTLTFIGVQEAKKAEQFFKI